MKGFLTPVTKKASLQLFKIQEKISIRCPHLLVLGYYQKRVLKTLNQNQRKQISMKNFKKRQKDLEAKISQIKKHNQKISQNQF